MSVVQKLIGLFCKNSQIKHTKLTKIFTKHGMYQAKMYSHKQQEYLALMSQNFFEVKNPILYIHSDAHQCNPLDGECGCNNQMDLALATICKDAGLIIYTSKNPKDIDELLEKINTHKLESQNEIKVGINLKYILKAYKGEYLTLDFILKDLKLSMVQLITDNPNVLFIVEALGIRVTKQTPLISFAYGETTSYKSNETIEAAKAISFEYDNNQ